MLFNFTYGTRQMIRNHWVLLHNDNLVILRRIFCFPVGWKYWFLLWSLHFPLWILYSIPHKKHLEEIEEALDFFLKTKIQDRVIYCNNTAGIQIKINLNKLLLVETYSRKLRYLMLGRDFCTNDTN